MWGNRTAGRAQPPTYQPEPSEADRNEAHEVTANVLYLLGSACFAAGTIINMVRA